MALRKFLLSTSKSRYSIDFSSLAYVNLNSNIFEFFSYSVCLDNEINFFTQGQRERKVCKHVTIVVT